MKRERIAERGIWTAKKRYILNVWDNEGVRCAKLPKIWVLKLRSSTPAPCRGYIKDCLNILCPALRQTLSTISRRRAEHVALPPNCCFPRSCNNSPSSRTAQLSTVSLLLSTFVGPPHNHYLRSGYKKKYNIINDGEKIKSASSV